MKWILSQVARLGDYMMSLPEQTRTQLIMVALLMLGGGSIYKLTMSLQRLSQPLPAATPGELLKPMERLFSETKGNLNTYQQDRQQAAKRLDSLATIPIKPTIP